MATTVIYEVGRSGRECSLLCGSLDDLAAAARSGALPPGMYWIRAVRRDGGRRAAADFGTLELRASGAWTLRVLDDRGGASVQACAR